MAFNKKIAVSSVLLAHALFAAGVEAKEVEVLTDANFQEMVDANKQGMLVKFYAPWCGHCKAMVPAYEEAAKKLDEEKMDQILAKLDATVETKAAQDAGVQGYPTLKYYSNGNVEEFDGGRDADGIIQWIKESGKPVVQSADDLSGDEVFSVVLEAPEETEEFANTARANKKKAKFFFKKVASDESKLVLTHKGEDKIVLDVPAEGKYEEVFKANSFPLFGELNGETFGSYMEAGKPLVWILLKMEAGKEKEAVEEVRAEMTKVAQKNEKYSVAHVDTVQFAQVMEGMFGIKEFPRVVVQKTPGDKKSFIYDGEMTAEDISAYVAKVDAGEIEPHLKSEEVPEEPQADAVKVVVGKNLEEQVFQADKDVVLEVYAPWCGHCKALEPEYTKFAEKIRDSGLDDMVMVAKLDGTLNDSPVDSIEWQGFPSLFYTKAGDSTPLTYDGARDANGLWEYLEKNHSNAEELKKRFSESGWEEKNKKEEEEKKAEEEAKKEEETPEEDKKEAKDEL